MESEEKRDAIVSNRSGQGDAVAAGGSEPMPPAEGAQTETPVEKANRLLAYLQEKYPDREISDETLNDAAFEALGERDSKLDGYATADETIKQVINDYPELALIIEDLADGVPFEVALAKQFDPEDIWPEGGINTDAAKEAHAARKAKRQEALEYTKRRDENIKNSNAEIQAFLEEQKANGWTAEDVERFIDFVDELMGDYEDGKISKTSLVRMLQAMNYDEAVAAAQEAGEVAGKNKVIEAKRIRKATEKDGLPTGGGASIPPVEQPAEESDVIDEVLRHQQRRSW